MNSRLDSNLTHNEMFEDDEEDPRIKKIREL